MIKIPILHEMIRVIKMKSKKKKKDIVSINQK